MKFEVSFIPDFKRLEESVALAEQYGVHFEYNDFFIPAVYTNPEELDKRIQTYMTFDRDRSKDTMHGVFLDITIHSNDPVIADYSKKCMIQSLEIAKRLGLRGVVFHTGLIAGFKDYTYVANWLNVNAEFFSTLCNKYSDIQIFMENMFDLDYELLLLLAQKMADVPNFGLCLDYAHAAISNVSAVEWLKNCAPFIKHIHINDNDLANDLHMTLGKGEIDWEEFKNELVKLVDEGVIKEKPSILLELKSLESFEESIEFYNKLFA